MSSIRTETRQSVFWFCVSIHGKLAVMPVVPTTLVTLFLFKRRNFPSAGFFDGQPYESHTVQKVCDNFLSQSRFSDIF